MSIAWTLVIPGAVAYRAGVFFEDGVKHRMDLRPTNARKLFREHREKLATIDRKLADTEAALSRELSSKERRTDLIPGLIQLRNQYKQDRAEVKSPLVLSPFYANQSNFYFLALYLGLGVHLVLSPGKLRLKGGYLILVPCLYVTWMSGNWIRNVWLFDHGRTIFSYANCDISPTSFVLQELRSLGVCIMIACSWQLWVRVGRRSNERSLALSGKTPIALQDVSSRVAKLFESWQLHSVLLVVGFLPWTRFYWVNSVKHGDHRYYTSAVALHLIWLFTWAIASRPAWLALHSWNHLRGKALARLAGALPGTVDAERRAFIANLSPITRVRLVIAGVASFASLVLPFLELARK